MNDATRYKYRSLPCYMEGWGNATHYVGGVDREGGAGVLEWCYSEDDARTTMAEMQKHPHRFTNLSVSVNNCR